MKFSNVFQDEVEGNNLSRIARTDEKKIEMKRESIW